VGIEDGVVRDRLTGNVQAALAQDVPVHVVTRQFAQHDRPAATALPPLLDVPKTRWAWVVTAFLLGAAARDALGDLDAVGRAVDRTLDLAEAGQAPAALISEAVDLLVRAGRPGPPDGPARRSEPLTHGETRVLRYLPSNLSAREIADELYLSMNTVKTHQRHLYRKLEARTRSQAVERARALGLLGPLRPRFAPVSPADGPSRARLALRSPSRP
jgi:LuxR family transcriptional regulator, maltose regulon positive regulatory protein